jgi:hypothetical protein
MREEQEPYLFDYESTEQPLSIQSSVMFLKQNGNLPHKSFRLWDYEASPPTTNNGFALILAFASKLHRLPQKSE